jgi:hypothetical protein
MDYPPAVCEKARRLEQLLVQLEAGEPLDRVCADLGLAVRATDLPRLPMRRCGRGSMPANRRTPR